jgi:hypothetical protein
MLVYPGDEKVDEKVGDEKGSLCRLKSKVPLSLW